MSKDRKDTKMHLGIIVAAAAGSTLAVHSVSQLSGSSRSNTHLHTSLKKNYNDIAVEFHTRNRTLVLAGGEPMNMGMVKRVWLLIKFAPNVLVASYISSI